METRDVKLYANNGLIKLQWQWATGDGGILVGAMINMYDGKGTFLGSMPLALSEVRQVKHHLNEMIEDASELEM